VGENERREIEECACVCMCVREREIKGRERKEI